MSKKDNKDNRISFSGLFSATLFVFVLCVIVVGILYVLSNSPDRALLAFRDRRAPVVKVHNLLSLTGQQYSIEDFVDEVDDATNVSYTYLTAPDFEKEGKQDIVIRFTDEAGNYVDKSLELTILGDIMAPVITGPEWVDVMLGESVSYKSYVTVEDDNGDYTLDIDNSYVDLNYPGDYDVIYTATDKAGNSSSKVVTIHVIEPYSDEYFLVKANELCDLIIEQIITPDMDDLHKVWAVYEYVREIPYILTDYTRNYLVEGYKMLNNYSGDCYGSYASVRLLLDRLGIYNIPIQTDEDYTRHFWNLVSLDGGETWYHVDATNWSEWGYKPVMCMISDRKLNEISTRHRGTHIYNADEYPSTPQESMPVPADIASRIHMESWEIGL